jgi:demethylmenaquinone methyltransferase/2-methoxy-6-polyprenyl-1,4-benzoquinol methylase
MANLYYDPGEKRAAKVNDLFAGIAGRYDLLNDIQSFGLHRAWKRRLVRMAGVRDGDAALDVCCGTGDIALRLAVAGAEVTGLDFSEPMLEVARQRPSAGLKVQFQQGDAQDLPFANNRFQAVTVGYGLRNLKHWERGLEEMYRVAAPGGRILVLDFGKPDNAAWRGLYFGYLRFAVPLFGRLFARNAPAYAYILESLRHYAAQNGVDRKLRQLGARDTRIINLLGGVMSINYGVKV